MTTTTSQLTPIVREFSRWSIMILVAVGIGIVLTTMFSNGAAARYSEAQ